MRHSVSSMIFSALLSLLVVGCGDDGEQTPQAMDQCLNSDDQLALRQISTPAPPPDAGVGAPDGGATDGGVPTDAGIDHDAVRDLMIGCILQEGCLEETLSADQPALELCIAPCTGPTPFVDISDGCRTCYFDTMICGLENCANLCLGGGPAEPCLACSEEHCGANRLICTGLE